VTPVTDKDKFEESYSGRRVSRTVGFALLYWEASFNIGARHGSEQYSTTLRKLICW
jgi:hypothetical protein